MSSGVGTMNSAGASNTPEASKFKRFLKRFGRRVSDDANGGSSGGEGSGPVDGVNGRASHTDAGISSSTAQGHTSENGRAVGKPGTPVGGGGAKKAGSGRQAKQTAGRTNKRSDSLLSGRFFHTSANGTSASQSMQPKQSEAARGQAGDATVSTLPTSKPEEGNVTESALSVPPDVHVSQMDGITDRAPVANGNGNALEPHMTEQNTTESSSKGKEFDETKATLAIPAAAAPGVLVSSLGVAPVIAQSDGEVQRQATALPASTSPHNSYLSQQSGPIISSDNDSELQRNSVDNNTVNTSKSRASTKPTTLMSLDTRENIQGSAYAPIAQFTSSSGNDTGSRNNGTRTSEAGSGGIQFATAPVMTRSASGTIVSLPGLSDPSVESPYTNVPSTTRPHPSNNPTPSSIPADNASVLTLASSNAAASILGGPASSRGHSHAAPSMGGGGARSIGGSHMGERRNSSDTYASVKALPPLSRRGSDSSQRTSRSIAASATGQNSHQAMHHGTASGMGSTGPGAPPDRISIHRTASQRTIATQLSIPLSTSNQILGTTGSAHASSGDDVLAAISGAGGSTRRASGQGWLGSSDAAPSASTPASTATPEQDDKGRVPSIDDAKSQPLLHGESVPTQA